MKTKVIFTFIYLVFTIFLFTGKFYPQTFELITEGAIVNDGGWNYGCAWGDYDNDGNEDLFVVNNETGNKDNFLYRNLGDGTFEKITTGILVNDGGSSYGCTWGDYDNDGWLDLFVANMDENNFLYHNNGNGTFTKITSGSVVNDGGPSTDGAWGDYDNDSYLDLYVTNLATNFQYHNNGDETFTRILSGPPAVENLNSAACAWGDYDNDGFIDLFVANTGPAYNSLFHNSGDGTFTQITGDPCVSDLEHYFSVTMGDYDNDGYLDILAVPGILTFAPFEVYLYHNKKDGSFERVTGIPHSGIETAGGSGMADIDNDGDLDIFISGYFGNNVLLLNDGEGSFTQVTSGVLVQNGNDNCGTGWADYDKDGDLDLFIAVNNFYGGNNRLFRNNGNENNWLEVKCTGNHSNRAAIGAVVYASSQINGNRVVQRRDIASQTGSSQNSLIAHFGLKESLIVDTLIIHWPSGIIDRFYNVNAGQIFEVVEGQTIPVELASFDVTAAGNDVILKWTTATEKNNRGFEIERQLVGLPGRSLQSKWAVIGFTAGSGTTTEPQSYSFINNDVSGGSYVYRLKQIDFNGSSSYSKELQVEVYASQFLLEQNYPNPFNPVTTIKFSLPADMNNVRVTIYNILGQKVTELVNGPLAPGTYQYKWDAGNFDSGVYVCELRTGKFTAVRKMLLLK